LHVQRKGKLGLLLLCISVKALAIFNQHAIITTRSLAHWETQALAPFHLFETQFDSGDLRFF
jgi:hypothetical protein